MIEEVSPPPPREDITGEHARVIAAVLDDNPVRIEIAQGQIQWESEIQPGGGAWLVADVTSDASCGVEQQARVRVRYHSELPRLQPSDAASLLLIGRVGEAGVVDVKSILHWGRDGRVAPRGNQGSFTLARETVMKGC